VKTRANAACANASRRWAAASVILAASLMVTGHAYALKFAPTHDAREGAGGRDGANAAGTGVAGATGSSADGLRNADSFENNPLAFLSALKRRCPQILEDPSSYDDDIVALCLQTRK
jgi:hypothetical protein